MTVVNTLLVLFSCISDDKPKFTRRLLLLLCFLYSWFLGWLICFHSKFFFSAPHKLAFLTHSIFCLLLYIFPFLFFHHLSHVLFCLSMQHRELFLPFFFFGWRAEVGLRVGGRLLNGGKGGKRASKTKSGCLLAGQAGNANLPGLPPVAAPWLSCWPTADWGWQPRSAPAAICPSFPTFCCWDLFFLFLVFYLNTITHTRTSTTSLKWLMCSKSLQRVTNLYFKLHTKLAIGYFKCEYKD